MNKFIVAKAVNRSRYDQLLERLRDNAFASLQYFPDCVHISEFPDSLTVFANFELGDSAGFCKRYFRATDKSTFAFDGLPYFLRLEVDKNWASQLQTEWINDEYALNNIFGTWALAEFSSSGLRVLSDFTGMTPIFYWRDSNYLAVSPRQMLLSAVCGERCHNLESLAWLTGQANLIGDSSPWSSVRHLPPQWTLTATEHPGDISPKFVQREIWTPDIDKSISSERINSLTSVLIDQCNALAKLPLAPLRIDITGGLDSRLVAALVDASDLKESVEHLQTAGPEDGHEVQVGRAVADMLGYRHRAMAKGATPNFDPHAIIERIRASMFRYEASICPSDGLVGVARNSRVIVTGSAGEIYRRHCKPHMKIQLNSHQQLIELFANYHQKTDPLSIEKEGIARSQSKVMQRYAGELFRQGADMNDITDIFFMRYRLPLWNGIMMNNLYGGVRVYPLINRQTARFAFEAGYEARVNNRIHFELLLELNPKLCSMPFLNYIWPREYEKRAKHKGVSLSERAFPVQGKATIRQKNSALSALMEDGWQLARDYVLDGGGSDLWSIVDRAEVEKMFSKGWGNFRGVVPMKQVFSLIGLKCVLSGDYLESRDGIQSKVKLMGASAQRLFGKVNEY